MACVRPMARCNAVEISADGARIGLAQGAKGSNPRTLATTIAPETLCLPRGRASAVCPRAGRGAWRTVVAVVALAALVCSATPPASPAQTKPRGGAHAQGTPIRYYNAALRSAVFVGRAVRAWNGAAVGTHFVAVSRRAADVVIRPAASRAGCNGLATIRGSRASSTRDVAISYGSAYRTSAVVKLGENCPLPEVRTVAAAHELGLVLGLHHQRRRCSVMSPRLDARNGSLVRAPVCSPSAWKSLLRRSVASADVRAARALYGDKNSPADAVPSDSTGSGFGPLWLWAAILLGGALVVYLVTRVLRR